MRVAIDLDADDVKAARRYPDPRELTRLGAGFRICSLVSDAVRAGRFDDDDPLRSATADVEATTVRYELERELRQSTATAATLRGVLHIMTTVDKLTANVERLERLVSDVLNVAQAQDEATRAQATHDEAALDSLADRVWAAGDKLKAALPPEDVPDAPADAFTGTTTPPSSPAEPAPTF